jgi:hypothetical protein
MDVIPVHAMILIMLHRCAILDMSCRLSSKMRYVTKRRVQFRRRNKIPNQHGSEAHEVSFRGVHAFST